MGKATDIAIGLFVLIIIVLVLTRMGLDLSSLITLFKHFFFGPSGSTGTNTTAGMILK